MIICPTRGNDKWGSGEYLASRGGRKHNGVDKACYKGSVVLTDQDGVITKIGYPYDPGSKKGYFRYVEVRSDAGMRVRYFYIEPCVKVGQRVATGDPIGVTQGLLEVYPGITDHYHFEVKNSDGKFIDPNKYLEGIQ